VSPGFGSLAALVLSAAARSPSKRHVVRPITVYWTVLTHYRLSAHFVSEALVYRLLKAHDLIARPAFIVIKAADAFKDKTTAPTSCGRPTSPT
jgi:hypothetical protein